MVPIAARDPGPRRHGGGEGFDARHELLFGAHVAQLHRAKVQAAFQEVHMRIDESGRDHAAAGIQHAGTRRDQFLNGGGISHREDRVTVRRQRFRPGMRRIPCPDPRVDHCQAGLLRTANRRAEHKTPQ